MGTSPGLEAKQGQLHQRLPEYLQYKYNRNTPDKGHHISQAQLKGGPDSRSDVCVFKCVSGKVYRI